MPTDLTKTLRKALAEFQAERDAISAQIAAIKKVLAAGGTRRPRGKSQSGTRRTRGRKAMSAAARKAVSRRMKAYWAKRRSKTAKGKDEGGK
jgi:16S rRNA G1207 methylase RsmC